MGSLTLAVCGRQGRWLQRGVTTAGREKRMRSTRYAGSMWKEMESVRKKIVWAVKGGVGVVGDSPKVQPHHLLCPDASAPTSPSLGRQAG